jgi:hypothetical protein
MHILKHLPSAESHASQGGDHLPWRESGKLSDYALSFPLKRHRGMRGGCRKITAFLFERGIVRRSGLGLYGLEILLADIEGREQKNQAEREQLQ